MRILLLLIKKEFKQIFRNKALLPMLFISPMIQLTIMPLAEDYEIKHILLSVVDHDRSEYSRKLVDKICSSEYFKLVSYQDSFDEGMKQIGDDRADIVMEIPPNFERDIIKENNQSIFIGINAINGIKAGLGSTYLQAIISDFNAEIRQKFVQPSAFSQTPQITLDSSNWYNPYQNYKLFMIPAILAMLINISSMFMSSSNIVREKEIGTIEQINVSPIKRYQFIASKLVPFWIIGVAIFSIGGLVVGFLVYGLKPLGSLFVIYSYLSIYLVGILGLGLWISTFAQTQQQAMSITFFFSILFMLMCGAFTPIDSMPHWAIILTKINPLSYFIDVMRAVVIKGSGFYDMRYNFLATILFAIGFNVLAVRSYSKRG